MSPHLGYVCPEVLDVPGRTAIRWHIANRAKELLGCTALGEWRQTDVVASSTQALHRVMQVLLLEDEIYVTYHDCGPPDGLDEPGGPGVLVADNSTEGK